jgi:hypothetical protein
MKLPFLKAGLLGVALAFAGAAQSAELARFNFNEGTGYTTTDATGGYVGKLGNALDPVADFSQLIDASPSGAVGDRSLTNAGAGFLMADDATKKLAVTNGPITVETWVYLPTTWGMKSAEGIVAYGASYKLGFKGGRQVFTLFGILDITNNSYGLFLADKWTHSAAAWEPGVGVHFYVDGVEYFEALTNYPARPPQHNYLSLGSEGTGNSTAAALDRVRIHNALLTADQLDSVAATPKPAYPTTLVQYDFNEPALPSTNSVGPAMPTTDAYVVLPALTGPTWSSDTPTGLPGDFSLGFLTEAPLTKEFVAAPYGSNPIDLGVNNTNYTLQAWIKVPTGPLENRRLIYRTDGPAPRASLSLNATRGLHTTLYGNTDFASSVLVPNDNRWHHVAAVMEGYARVRFYLDGILRQTVNRTATAVPTSSTGNQIYIGKESETVFFRGLLDRVIINNNALTNSAAAPIDYPAIPGLPVFPTLASHPAAVATNLGSTVTFTATPTGATGLQWYYRTNLADHVGVKLEGQTSTTLTLDSIVATNLGYYYLVATNEVGSTESYAAALSLPVDLTGKLFDFEPPTYTSGLLEGQDGWTHDQNANAARVLTATEITNQLALGSVPAGEAVHSGNQALLVNGIGLASTSIRRITGLETATNVTIEFWARALPMGTLGTATGNVFIALENASGTRSAALRFGPSYSIDYGSTNSGVWVASGLTADTNKFQKFTFKLNFQTKLYEFLVDGVNIKPEGIGFYNAGSESLRQIRVFRGASQAGLILDDLNVPSPLTIASSVISNGNIVIKWKGGTPPFQLQRRAALDSGTWENVGGTTTATEASDTLGTGPAFYRVTGQ